MAFNLLFRNLNDALSGSIADGGHGDSELRPRSQRCVTGDQLGLVCWSVAEAMFCCRTGSRVIRHDSFPSSAFVVCPPGHRLSRYFGARQSCFFSIISVRSGLCTLLLLCFISTDCINDARMRKFVRDARRCECCFSQRSSPNDFAAASPNAFCFNGVILKFAATRSDSESFTLSRKYKQFITYIKTNFTRQNFKLVGSDPR